MNLFDLFIKIGVDDQASGHIANLSNKLGNGLKTAAKIGTAAVGVAMTGITALTTKAVNSFSEFEQLAGGAAKIFDQIDQTKILEDANNAYKNLGLSANQYLAIINDVGATFAATMGDEAGYRTAQKGLQAISDYASGTGKNVDELSQKFTLITRSTASYQSIADQFSGILPATSADFLEQAQAAGILSENYTKLTEVPVAEYQQAVSEMLVKGVSAIGLANNTAVESFTTVSGSINATKASWQNFLISLGTGQGVGSAFKNLIGSASAVKKNLEPVITEVLDSFGSLVKEELPDLVAEIPDAIGEVLPKVVEVGSGLVGSITEGLLESAPSFLDSATELFSKFSEKFKTGFPDFVENGMEMITGLVDKLTSPESLEKLFSAGGDILHGIADGVVNFVGDLSGSASAVIDNLKEFLFDQDNLLKMAEGGLEIVTKLATAIIDNLPELAGAAKSFVESFLDYIFEPENLKKMAYAMTDFVGELGNSISQAVSEIFGGDYQLLPEGMSLSEYLERYSTENLRGENGDKLLSELAVIHSGEPVYGPVLPGGGRGGSFDIETVNINVDGAEATDPDELAESIVSGMTEGLKSRVEGIR